MVCRLFLFFLLFFFLVAWVLAVSASWNPEPALTVFHARVLAGEVNALAQLLVATLREVAGACAEGRLDGGISGDPVCEGIFTVLNDAVGPRSVNGIQARILLDAD